MAGTIIFLAALIRHLRAGMWQWAVVASAAAGVTATVRNAGIGLVPALVVAVIVTVRRAPSNAGRILAAALVPVLVIVASERAARHVVFGNRATSLLGPHLFAKAALIEAPPGTDMSTALDRALDRNLAVAYAPVREVIHEAPFGAGTVLTLYYESCLQGICTRAVLPPNAPVGVAMDDALLGAALRRIARAPLAFTGLVLRDYFSLWMPFKQEHPTIARALNTYTASHHPMPFQTLTFAIPDNQPVIFHGRPFVLYVYPVVLLIGMGTGAIALVGSVMAIRGRLAPLALQIACIAALAAHGQLLFSASFAAGISRFMIAAWPTVTIAMLLAGWCVVRRYRLWTD